MKPAVLDVWEIIDAARERIIPGEFLLAASLSIQATREDRKLWGLSPSTTIIF
ncbi:hypothetical protein [Pseudofrankia sp. BMG5.37]|uniref:hypothetical protein n=1 Tax=Pseudofrankia sp. BMG5.37 TaxID=3050035 RepID=UPI0028948715|nr:hypothetical protein [Pseudofrankia sp. BMG5.37]MDT3442262.1 hypothetical protein [Pseudofrankia sp. BMG5.37]